MLSKFKSFFTIPFLCTALLCSQIPSVYATEDIDTGLIEKVSRDSFQYFLNYTPKKTGFVRDSSRPGSPCSIAGIGFYLAALPVAVEHKWLSRQNAYQKAMKVLKTLDKKSDREHGFFYHFIDPHSGKRAWGSEISSIVGYVN